MMNSKALDASVNQEGEKTISPAITQVIKQTYRKYVVSILVLCVVYAIFQVLFRTGLLNSYYERIIRQIGIFSIAALGLNLILGFTGQFTLGHAAFMSIGAYTSAILTTQFQVPFILAILAGSVMAGVMAAIIGFPILRLSGDYLAICTLGFGEIVKVFIQNVDYLGGARGISAIPSKSNFTVIFILLVLCFAIIMNLMHHSSKGRAIMSIKNDEIAAEAMGINITKYKIIAFVIGCAMAGLAGGLYAHFNLFIDPPSFNFSKSFELMTYVVLGGMGSLSGSLVGTTILISLPEALRGLSAVFKEYRMLIYAFLLIVMMLFKPQGILGNQEITWKKVKAFFRAIVGRFHKKGSE